MLSVNTLRSHAQTVGTAIHQAWEEEEQALFSGRESEVWLRPRPLPLTLDGVMIFLNGGWHEVKLGYLHTPPSRMRYQTFRESGYHIGSGVAEAGCKGVIQARLKGVGMRWGELRARSMLALRCGVCSSRVPDFRGIARQQLATT